MRKPLSPEESALAGRFHRDAMRLCVWLARRNPYLDAEDAMLAGDRGLIKGARSAAERLGPEPTDEQLRDHMLRNAGWMARDQAKRQHLKKLRRQAAGATTAHLDDFEGGAATVRARTDRLSPQDLRDLDRIRDALATLPDKARFVIQAHAEGRTFAEAGAEAGMSRQGAQQLYTRAVARIRHQLGAA